MLLSPLVVLKGFGKTILVSFEEIVENIDFDDDDEEISFSLAATSVAFIR